MAPLINFFASPPLLGSTSLAARVAVCLPLSLAALTLGSHEAAAAGAPQAEPQRAEEATPAAEAATDAEAPEPAPTPAPARAQGSGAPAVAQSDVWRDASAAPGSDESEPEGEKPELKRMMLSLSIRAGGALGGDDLIEASYSDGSTQTLSAGDGLIYLFGLTFSPLMIGQHRLGAAVEIGERRAFIGENTDAEFSMKRTLFTPRLQYGYEVTRGIVALAAVGAEYQTGLELKAKGVVKGTASFDNALGPFAEAGMLVDVGFGGFDLTLRRSWLEYEGSGMPPIDAGSYSFLFGVHVGILKRAAGSPSASAQQARR